MSKAVTLERIRKAEQKATSWVASARQALAEIRAGLAEIGQGEVDALPDVPEVEGALGKLIEGDGKRADDLFGHMTDRAQREWADEIAAARAELAGRLAAIVCEECDETIKYPRCAYGQEGCYLARTAHAALLAADKPAVEGQGE